MVMSLMALMAWDAAAAYPMSSVLHPAERKIDGTKVRIGMQDRLVDGISECPCGYHRSCPMISPMHAEIYE